ncbi:hypothetical protein Sjap_010940 [Stephania japonica]|uniref:Uncharacterized protein n=1 Tax=Stephania japonica TaxID=461633 RepID=A0AAP0JAI9_9MAGN
MMPSKASPKLRVFMSERPVQRGFVRADDPLCTVSNEIIDPSCSQLPLYRFHFQ